MIAALVSVTLSAAWIGAVVIARHRAQTAADLAALAAAQSLAAGPAAACGRAASVAAAMGATVQQCTVDGLDVVVEAGVGVKVPVGTRAQAVARAGPVGVS